MTALRTNAGQYALEVRLECGGARVDERLRTWSGLGWQEIRDPDEAAAPRPVRDDLHRGVMVGETGRVKGAVRYPPASVVHVDHAFVRDETVGKAHGAYLAVHLRPGKHRGKQPVRLGHLPKRLPRRVCRDGNRGLDVNGSHTLAPPVARLATAPNPENHLDAIVPRAHAARAFDAPPHAWLLAFPRPSARRYRPHARRPGTRPPDRRECRREEEDSWAEKHSSAVPDRALQE